MKSSLNNSVRIIGNLGMTPEIKNFGNEKKIAKFSVATSESFKNANGEKEQITQWHNIVVFGKLAGIVEKYMQKGQMIALEGQLTNRSYIDKSGNKKYITEIKANEIQMLGKKAS
jgi:single-strand DNA-binding protein